MWHITADQNGLPHNLTVVSTIPLPDGVQYRVIGDPPMRLNPTPAMPSLEDSYIWLMQDTSATRMPSPA